VKTTNPTINNGRINKEMVQALQSYLGDDLIKNKI